MSKFINNIENAENLQDLLEAVQAAREAGVEFDATSLPVFGGEEPADTAEVWSWDAGRLLVGAGEWGIVDR